MNISTGIYEDIPTNFSTYSHLREYSYEYTGSTAIYENIPMNISTGIYEDIPMNISTYSHLREYSYEHM